MKNSKSILNDLMSIGSVLDRKAQKMITGGFGCSGSGSYATEAICQSNCDDDCRENYHLGVWQCGAFDGCGES